VNHSMAELVNSMRLAQQYAGTVVAGEYSRAMLGAARTLAVNAKHLLDVIDAIRACSNIFCQQRLPPDGATGDVQPKETAVLENSDSVVKLDCFTADASVAQPQCEVGVNEKIGVTSQPPKIMGDSSPCGFDMNSLLMNSDDEYDDEKFDDSEQVSNPDVDPMSSEADRCLEAVEENTSSDHEDDENDDEAMDLITSALHNLR
jgi:hypothetical protein